MIIAEAAAQAAANSVINNTDNQLLAESDNVSNAAVGDVDLNCAEKVTDSDTEVDVDDSKLNERSQSRDTNVNVTNSDNEDAITVTSSDDSVMAAATRSDDTTDNQTTAATNSSTSDSNRARDFTCKPKAIKAHRQTTESTLLSYQQIPFLAFHSPKNPTGVSPFQPTGM